MKAINVFLAIVVSLLMGGLVLEGGLRLLGKGPPKTLNKFDPTLGWAKKPNFSMTRKAKEFKVRYELNEQGLRDDSMTDTAKPNGQFRVIMLGDSFTQGWSVDRSELFVDQLERWWKAENRNVEVINAGTEGYSTDQSIRWLADRGVEYEPDLVILFPYDNDVYWNGQTDYMGKAKPRYGPDGELDNDQLTDTGDNTWKSRFALTRLFIDRPDISGHFFKPGEKMIEKEHAVTLVDYPDFMLSAEAHTLGGLKAFKEACDNMGARGLVVPIPSHAVVDDEYRQSLGNRLGLSPSQWDPEKPIDRMLTMAQQAGLETLDVRTTLKAASRGDQSLYNDIDWHFNPNGNETFASFLHDQLDAMQVFPATHRAPAGRSVAMPAVPPSEKHAPDWLKLYGVLWLLLTALYYGHYKDEPKWQPPLKVAAMLAAVFTIIWGARTLVGMLPPQFSQFAMLGLVAAILGFVLYKVGGRLGTILELMKSFILRGHWYLMPLVVVLLTIGSLLVVAASSPLVAPFIYTLF